MKFYNLRQLSNSIYIFIDKACNVNKVTLQLLLLIYVSSISAKEITAIFNGKLLKLIKHNSNELHGKIDGKKVIATTNKNIASKRARYLGTFKKLKRNDNENKLITYHVFEQN